MDKRSLAPRILAFIFVAIPIGCRNASTAPTAADQKLAEAGMAVVDASVPLPVDSFSQRDLLAVDAPRLPQLFTVNVQNGFFYPLETRIRVGDVVKWIWNDGTSSVTSGFLCHRDGLFDSGKRSWPQAAPFYFKFNIQSDFPYYSTTDCENMIGVIGVDP